MEFAHIDIDRIHPPKYLLRPVKKITIGYQETLDSIQAHGLWQPLLVRPIDNDYELVDGNYRFNCCKQLRYEQVPCFIRELSDELVLLAQLQANGIRMETTPVEFAERVAFILQSTPGLTIPQLSRKLKKSPHWLRKILRLNTNDPEVNKMVIRGEMPVESACALARLPLPIRHLYIQHARTLPVREFVKLARGELKRFRELCREKYIDNHPVNQDKPVPFLRKGQAIRHEYARPTAAGPILLETEAKTPADGWRACLSWVLHMDPESLKMQEDLIEGRNKQLEEAAARRRQERQELMEARKRAGDASLLIDGCSFTPITEFGEPNDE